MASEEHKELAAFIKGVHKKLRIQSRFVGEDEAWHQHCKQIEVLERYAENMQLLATEFWKKDGERCRIEWVIRECMIYFFDEGEKLAHDREVKLGKRFLDNYIGDYQNATRGPKLKLLDVGSCYNPFLKCSLFDVTALDLMPATVDVMKCDFLSVKISCNFKTEENKCYELPANYFDIVVFSLLLEYFPSSKQRFKCCKNAYEVLKPGGVLFILTPDSKHASANAKVMKSWRFALASLGYWRINYQKLKHLHCMSYRKCVDSQIPKAWFSAQKCQSPPEDLFYIPQDFHEYCDSLSDSEEIPVRSDEDNKLLAEVFGDLPEGNVFEM